MFKKFFKTVSEYIVMPFKSELDINEWGKDHPKAVKVVKIIKGVITAINAYIDLWSINELLKAFGIGFKHFPDIVKIFTKGAKVMTAVV